MAGVTISGAGSTLPDGTNITLAKQAAAMINSVIASTPGAATTMTAGGTAPSNPGDTGRVLVVDTPNQVSIFTSNAYQYFVVADGTVGGGAGAATVRGGGAQNQQVILGTRTVTFAPAGT